MRDEVSKLQSRNCVQELLLIAAAEVLPWDQFARVFQRVEAQTNDSCNMHDYNNIKAGLYMRCMFNDVNKIIGKGSIELAAHLHGTK
jgi:hypothetical protein